CELEEEVRIGSREVEDDDAVPVVDADSAPELASTRCAQARSGTNDVDVVSHVRALDREEAFNGAAEIACAKWPAVRIADSRPEPDRVRASSVCRCGERRR